jgi:hypothetical protein
MTYLLGVMQTLIVVLQCRNTFLLPFVSFSAIHHVTSQEFLPEGKAAGGACETEMTVSGALVETQCEGHLSATSIASMDRKTDKSREHTASDTISRRHGVMWTGESMLECVSTRYYRR